MDYNNNSLESELIEESISDRQMNRNDDRNGNKPSEKKTRSGRSFRNEAPNRVVSLDSQDYEDA